MTSPGNCHNKMIIITTDTAAYAFSAVIPITLIYSFVQKLAMSRRYNGKLL